jgi:hypothetical protein
MVSRYLVNSNHDGYAHRAFVLEEGASIKKKQPLNQSEESHLSGGLCNLLICIVVYGS